MYFTKTIPKPLVAFIFLSFGSYVCADTTNPNCEIVFIDVPELSCNHNNVLNDPAQGASLSSGLGILPAIHHSFTFKHDIYSEPAFNRESVVNSLNFNFFIDLPNINDARYFLITIDNEFQLKYAINEYEFLSAIQGCKNIDKHCGRPFSYYIDGIFNNKINGLAVTHRELSTLNAIDGEYQFNLNLYLGQHNYNIVEGKIYDVRVDLLNTYHKSIASENLFVVLSEINGKNDSFIDSSYLLSEGVLHFNATNTATKEEGFVTSIRLSKGKTVFKIDLPNKLPLSIGLPPNITYLSISTNHNKGFHKYETKIEVINKDRFD